MAKLTIYEYLIDSFKFEGKRGDIVYISGLDIWVGTSYINDEFGVPCIILRSDDISPVAIDLTLSEVDELIGKLEALKLKFSGVGDEEK